MKNQCVHKNRSLKYDNRLQLVENARQNYWFLCYSTLKVSQNAYGTRTQLLMSARMKWWFFFLEELNEPFAASKRKTKQDMCNAYSITCIYRRPLFSSNCTFSYTKIWRLPKIRFLRLLNGLEIEIIQIEMSSTNEIIIITRHSHRVPLQSHNTISKYSIPITESIR